MGQPPRRAGPHHRRMENRHGVVGQDRPAVHGQQSAESRAGQNANGGENNTAIKVANAYSNNLQPPANYTQPAHHAAA